MAHFELHILNFNGAHFLPACLNTLERIEKGSHSVTVNVVDNGSTDGSNELIRKNYSWVNFIPLGRNLGYAEGNNEGARRAIAECMRARGAPPDYHVFLNNDTTVEPSWLIEAARAFESDPAIGIVGSKSLFFDHFVVVRISVRPAFQPSSHGSLDTRVLGAFLMEPLEGNNLLTDPKRIRFKNAFVKENGGRWLAPQSTIYLPVIDPKQPLEVKLKLRFVELHGQSISVDFSINSNEELVFNKTVQGGTDTDVLLNFTPQDYVRVIQNCGSFVTSHWDAGDIGFGEIDNGSFDNMSDVSSVCGVSMFIRHSLWQQLGGFDKKYFAYFEDTDLSVRAQLLGFKCTVVPSSVLNHIHCGSSGGENSPQFNRLVAFSHLLFTNKFAQSDLWSHRRRELFQAAQEQYQRYFKDHEISDKPQLHAFKRYLKNSHYFLWNRIRRIKNQTKLDLFPFRDRMGRSSQEN